MNFNPQQSEHESQNAIKKASTSKLSRRDQMNVNLLQSGASTMQLKKDLMPVNFYDYDPIAMQRHKKNCSR